MKKQQRKRAPARAPKVWQRTIAGKKIGSYHVTIGGERVNLGTKDAGLALKLRADALRGQRKFRDDAGGAAEATVAALDAMPDFDEHGQGPATTGQPSSGTPSEGSTPSTGPSEASDDAQPAVAGSDPFAAAAAAAESPSETPGAPPPPMELSPEFVASMLSTIAAVLVDLQIRAQDYCAARALKCRPGVIAPDHRGREKGARLWEGQLRKWVRTDIPLPEWAQALITVGVETVPTQIMERTPLAPDGHPVEPPAPAAPVVDADIVTETAAA